MAAAPTPYALKIETNSLVLFDQAARPIKALEFPSPAIITSGSSVVLTPFGLVVTGPTPSTSCSAFLWDGTRITVLPELLSEHICHGSAFYKGKVLVIGGLNSRVVEAYAQGADAWEQGVHMPAPKAFFGVTIVSNTLYLIGGVGVNGRYHDSILTFNGVEWGKLPLKVPKKLRGAGTFPTSDTALLVFGGKVEDAEAKRVDNLEIWAIDLQANTCSGVGTLPVAGQFSGFQAVDLPRAVAVTGDNSLVLLWDKTQRNFTAAVTQ